ncbi:hypothetical protein LSH36_327g03055, partial [Paralvinella palmiformis]
DERKAFIRIEAVDPDVGLSSQSQDTSLIVLAFVIRRPFVADPETVPMSRVVNQDEKGCRPPPHSRNRSDLLSTTATTSTTLVVNAHSRMVLQRKHRLYSGSV